MTLIQKLAKMTMEQNGEDLSDIDPRTGARRKTTNIQDNRVVGEEEDGVDESSEVIQPEVRSMDNESRTAKEEAAAIAGYIDVEGTAKKEGKYQNYAVL